MELWERVADFLQAHMLSCPSRSWLHLDCPGCGMQRSIISLLRGHYQESMQLHPAGAPFLMLVLFVPLHLMLKFRHGWKIIIGLQALIAMLSFGFYVYKIFHHQLTH